MQPSETISGSPEPKTITADKQPQFGEDLKRVAHIMYAQSLTLVQINRTLSILRAIDLIILESNRNLPQLSKDISQAIVGSSSYVLASVLSLDYQDDDYLHFQGWALNETNKDKMNDPALLNSLAQLKIHTDSKWVSSPSRNLIVDIQNLDTTKKLADLNSDIEKTFGSLQAKFGVSHLYFTKLKVRGGLMGVMAIGLDSEPHLDDIELIERLGEPTGIAFSNRLLYEENQNVLKQLEQNNNKLKEIDEAKDEFISMASHQLRTPLTSMKGYVSMVLDDEAGPITGPQRDMLQRAFNSSQRMVYLISDLLNLSRLKTGRFIISNVKTDLLAVVESEFNQLAESAKAKQIQFTFNKPPDFPILMLDETKIRQVVMNFLDNAIFYTPTGGQVTVELKATDKTIEYLVTDTGIGIPKDEQHNLFTKFYRARNARKIRPDGTGLGLYMVKKVIIAQGGTILFNSVEGQGSVFGFSFSREKIEAPAEPLPS
jgi:signal transduction histidine kinase